MSIHRGNAAQCKCLPIPKAAPTVSAVATPLATIIAIIHASTERSRRDGSSAPESGLAARKDIGAWTNTHKQTCRLPPDYTYALAPEASANLITTTLLR